MKVLVFAGVTPSLLYSAIKSIIIFSSTFSSIIFLFSNVYFIPPKI